MTWMLNEGIIYCNYYVISFKAFLLEFVKLVFEQLLQALYNTPYK